ncbi:hypothetical protein PoMZ_02300 [Pyricularia oryzae]|uniref:Lipocalin-like domain-containing protein n=1 Tax=Pyricularia oryzae TaxID=318829 RepID=A0A4P7N8R6_PYROR|nr:hypothetical protein PoMZ_02300 [Pyricularia oryzae]
MKHDAILAVLAGTYTMINQTNPDSVRTWGDAPHGHITYTTHGFMSAVMASTNPEHRPPGITNSAEQQADPSLVADFATIAKHTMAYAAPYVVGEGSTTTSGVLVHGPLAVNTLPSFEGRMWTRWYTYYEGTDVLFLRLNETSEAGVWWRRIS